MDGNTETESTGAIAYDITKDPKRKAKSNDPGWKYGYWPNLAKKDLIQCILCGGQYHSGVKRLKQHLVGGYGDAEACPNVTQEIRKEIADFMKGKKRKTKLVLMNDVGHSDDDDDDDDVQEIPRHMAKKGKVSSGSSSVHPSSGTLTKRKQKTLKIIEQSIDNERNKSVALMVRKTPEEVVDERHGKGLTQTTLEKCTKSKEAVERFKMHIVDFFYENGISFHAARSRSYEVMVESIGQMGPGVKPPSYHELRLPLLTKALNETNKLKEKHMVAWKQYGCTLMSDGWSDGKRRHLGNFLANSPEGTFFLGSVDASSEVQDGKLLAGFLEKMIISIGKENVVQVVSDNGSNFKKAGELLQHKFPTLYWTPCSTHCLNLMLADIGKLSEFKNVIHKARQVTLFIYKHTRLLAFMREKTGGKELVRPGATRFATSFLTLQNIFRHRDSLKSLFVSEQWSTFKLSKTSAGRKICDTVLSSSFWGLVEDCIRASHPFLIVLRIADADEHPVMPELTMAMDIAKKSVQNSLAHKPRLLRDVLSIVEGRWSRQMGVKLYGAALFLNPSKYFELKVKDNVYARKQRAMFNDVLEKMFVGDDLQALISDQVDEYDNMRGNFSKSLAIKQQKTKSPLDWWNAYGNLHIELQSLAFRIVSLCSSSSGYERNWSTFQFIHSKRRNKLEHQRLNDLVYVQYNRKIISRFQKRREQGGSFNPLILEEFQWDNEWVTNVPKGARVYNSVDEIFDEIFGEDHEEFEASGFLRLENAESEDFLDEDSDGAQSIDTDYSSSDEVVGGDKNDVTTYFDDE